MVSGYRLFASARIQKSLTEKEEAEEAHRQARVDSFVQGPESAARQSLSRLQDKERIFKNAFGPRLTWKEQVDLRFLRFLYPQDGPFGLFLTMSFMFIIRFEMSQWPRMAICIHRTRNYGRNSQNDEDLKVR